MTFCSHSECRIIPTMNKGRLLIGWALQRKSSVLGQAGNEILQFIIHINFEL